MAGAVGSKSSAASVDSGAARSEEALCAELIGYPKSFELVLDRQYLAPVNLPSSCARPSRACHGRPGGSKTGEFSFGAFGEFTSGAHMPAPSATNAKENAEGTNAPAIAAAHDAAEMS